MWTNRASGKTSKIARIRARCGGDLRMIRLGVRNVTRSRNQTSACCQRRRASGETVSRSKYSGYCGGSLGKIIVR